jgi:CHAT domain-containing protein/tetratricopeptide (TPR) repeat protein
VGAHPDPTLIAAHVDGRLAGDEAARMDEHLAGCPDCYDVFAETVRFTLAESEAATAGQSAARPAPLPFLRRPSFRLAAGLSMAAALILALGLWFSRARFQGAPTPLVAELAEAMGERRFVEPRLTGGFRHGRLTTMRSSDTPQGLDAQSPAVLAAVAQIRQRAEGDTSPDALGALGATYLVSGDAAAAVKALESATAQKPDDAHLLSDLSAAYLVRAKQADEPADIPKALEAAERAVALKDPPAEAYFNRALALEGLHLVDAARKAWQDYLERDSTSGWADEARQHLEALPREKQASAEEEKARVRAALAQGITAVDAIADEVPSLLRDYFEDELLPAWAEAHLVGHPDAAVQRENATAIGDALLRATSDAMARDTARALTQPEASATARDPLRSQAIGYRTLREARRLYNLQKPSCAQFRQAVDELGAGASPYTAWARVNVVIACLYPAEPQAALADLGRLQSVAEPHGYRQLLGRVHYLQGLIKGARGELTDSLRLYTSARACFETTRDGENGAYLLAAMAEVLHLLGDTRAAWNDRMRSLARLSDVRNPLRRHVILNEAQLACVTEGLPRSALHLGTALVETAYQLRRPLVANEALIRRAGIYHALNADVLAASDLAAARRLLDGSADKSHVQKLQAEADAVEGEILTQRQPEEAARSLGRALAYFKETEPTRVPAIHLLLARAHIGRGHDDLAEHELDSGISALERQRISLSDAALQASFFDQSVPLFDDMVRLQVDKRGNPQRALAYVERGRARQLVDSLLGAAASPLDPERLREELPERVTLVYYWPLHDRVLAWLLSRENSHFIERSLPAAELSRLVAAHRAALEGRAAQEIVRRTAARLHDELVRPFIPLFASQRALVFIPDGVLQSVPFASLWDRQTGRYLVEDYVLGVAPSGTVFVHASAGAGIARGGALRALVVGNPQFDPHVWTGLSNLPEAEAEAAEIAGLYSRSELLTGPAATKPAFLRGVRGREVIHYAGHAAASADAPSTAHLLFAPDPRSGDSGALYLHDLGRGSLPGTRVVVLAACRTAAGDVSRVEGALSLGRPFLAAGVPDVVASLWDIDDALSRRFFVFFHRALLTEGDPLPALRTAQIAMLRDGDVSLAHPASWAAFICMGGLDPHSLSKGELS